MAIFYNSSAIINSVSMTNATIGAIVATNAVISGTIQSATVAAIRLSGAVSTENVSRMIFSNSNTISFGISTDANGATVTGTLPSLVSISVSAGGTNGGISTLIFSNNTTGGFNFGLATGAGIGTITASTNLLYDSYYRYPHLAWGGSATFTLVDGNTATSFGHHFQGFNLPYPVSIQYVRMPVTQNIQAAGMGTVAAVNGSGALSQIKSIYFNIYTLGTGASSSQLMRLTQVSYSSLWAWAYSYNTLNSAHTISETLSYQLEGNTVSYSTSYAQTSANISPSSSHLTGFTGNRFIDIPAVISLSAGPYWLMIAGRDSFASAGSMSAVLNNNRHSLFYSNYVLTNYASGFSPMGLASTYLKLGQGRSTATTENYTNTAAALSNILTAVSNMEVPFEMRRT